jgi:drug/metabolite transporter (DMT)-like permease
MLLMVVLWAGAFVAAKLSVSSGPGGFVAPELVAFLRFLVAGVLMFAILAIWKRDALSLNCKDLPLLFGLGATGIAGYNLCFFWGARLSLASDGAAIIPTLNPILTMFAAAILLGERLTRRKLAGAALSLVGQSLIFWALFRASASDPQRMAGNLFFLAGVLFWTTYSILGRIAARRFSPLVSTTWATLSGTLLLLPFALYGASYSNGYTPTFWIYVGYLAIGGTVGGFVLWSRGVHRMGASRTAVFLNLVPVATLVLAFFLLGERPALTQVIGILIVMAGVYVATTAPPVTGRAEAIDDRTGHRYLRHQPPGSVR